MADPVPDDHGGAGHVPAQGPGHGVLDRGGGRRAAGADQGRPLPCGRGHRCAAVHAGRLPAAVPVGPRAAGRHRRLDGGAGVLDAPAAGRRPGTCCSPGSSCTAARRCSPGCSATRCATGGPTTWPWRTGRRGWSGSATPRRRSAAAAERARIARELHDVVAHNVSVMVVQADGAGYALAGEPERARQALTAISGHRPPGAGRDAPAARRAAVRRPGRPTWPRSPALTSCGELLEQARAAGLTVTFTLEGEPRPLPEGVGAGRLPGGPGVADQRAQARRARRLGVRAAPVHAERAARPGDRRRARRGRRGRRRRAGPDRHARAGRRCTAARWRPGRGPPAATRSVPRCRWTPTRLRAAASWPGPGPAHDDPDHAGRRPGAGPDRVPHGARRAAGHDRGRRGRGRPGRDRGGPGAPVGRHGDGRADAAAGRRRGDPAHPPGR